MRTAVLFASAIVAGALVGGFIGFTFGDATWEGANSALGRCTWEAANEGGDTDVQISAATADNGTQVRYSITVSDDVGRVAVRDPATVTRVDGGSRNIGGISRSQQSMTVTVTTDATREGDGFVMAPLPEVLFGGDTCTSTAADAVKVSGRGNFTATKSDDFVLVSRGPHEIFAVREDGVKHRFVVPLDVTGDQFDRKTAAVTILSAEEMLDVGSQTTRVTYFVIPKGGGPAGKAFVGAYGDADQRTVWVDSEANPRSLGSVWTHEFVHTKQDFDTGRQMQWFVEGSAQYLTYLMQYQQSSNGSGDMDTFHCLVSSGQEYDETVLSQPDTWGKGAEYHRGATVLLGLDVRLRETTGGETTVVDLLRWANGQEKLTYDEFRQWVRSKAGEPTADWADDHIRGTRSVSRERLWSPASGPVDGEMAGVGMDCTR